MRAVLLALLPVAAAAPFDSVALLEKAREQIQRSTVSLARYTCVQTVRRARFEPLQPPAEARCGKPAEEFESSRLLLSETDQFRLDITVSQGAEIFSWPGARAFESADAQSIVGDGMTATGDFGRFLSSIFSPGKAEVRFARLEKLRGSEAAAYRYRVSKERSTYQLRSGGKARENTTLAYEGTFWLHPATAALRRLTIEVPEPPPASETCRIETAIDYPGGAALFLPELTALTLWNASGSRLENRTSYSNCRAFQSDSVFRPETLDAGGEATSASAARNLAAAVLPAGAAVHISLRGRIDPETSFAGDAVEGQLALPILGRGGKVVAPQGASVLGRIVRLERHYQPSSYIAVGLQFTSLQSGGAEIPLMLEAVPRSRAEQLVNGAAEKRAGMGVFLFTGQRLSIDRAFISEWKVSRGRRGP